MDSYNSINTDNDNTVDMNTHEDDQWKFLTVRSLSSSKQGRFNMNLYTLHKQADCTLPLCIMNICAGQK